jgi:hypothetical protein
MSMPYNLLNMATCFCRFVAVAVLLFAGSIFVFAQSTTSSNPNDPINAGRKNPSDDPSSLGSIEDEMRAKRAIKLEEKEHRENLERAHSISNLGGQLMISFKEKNSLDREDLKKLDKLEKLVKAIRRAAGGSEDNVEMEKPPGDLPCAISKLAELAESLKDGVEKTPKHVISAAVIDQANVLLELIRAARDFAPKG